MNKTKSVRVRLTDTEWEQTEIASLSLFGLNNKSRLIRKLVRDYIGFGPDLTDDELKEFRQAVRQLTGIARNLNQLTARVNKNESELSRLTDGYLEQILQHVLVVNQQLKDYILRTVTRYQEAVNHDHFEQ